MQLLIKRILKVTVYTAFAVLTVFSYLFLNSRGPANFKLLSKLPGQAPYAYADAPGGGTGEGSIGGGGEGSGSGTGESGTGESGAAGEGCGEGGAGEGSY